MSYQTLLYDSADGVATITLNRPEQLNTIVPPMPDELEAAVHRAVADPKVKVIILRGAGAPSARGSTLAAGFTTGMRASPPTEHGIPVRTSSPRPRRALVPCPSS